MARGPPTARVSGGTTDVESAVEPAQLRIVGTGSLARAICESLAVVADRPLGITVIGRSPDAVHGFCYVANTRARLSGSAARFRPCVGSLSSVDATAELLAGTPRNAVTVNVASHQAPAETHGTSSAWAALVRSAGLGVTLPLQATIACRVGEAIAAIGDGCRYLNAAFPDAVNPVLKQLGLPVFAGLGNVAILAATLQSSLGLSDQSDLKLLGHHVHLATPDGGQDVRAWYRGEPVTAVGDLLAAQRATSRQLLNGVTGHVSAMLLRDLAYGRSLQTNLPGPAGLPGGYPVRIRGGIDLALPDGMSRTDAVDWNQSVGAPDGVRFTGDGRVEFLPAVAERLAAYLPELASGFRVADLAGVTSEFIELRERLRGIPRHD